MTGPSDTYTTDTWASPQGKLAYKIVHVPPPPAFLIAPNGFPTDPLPKDGPPEFLDSMKVRLTVFCDEQKCAREPELDKDDPRSHHWVIYEHPLVSHSDDTTVLARPHPDEPTTYQQPINLCATIRLCPPPHDPHPNGYVADDEEPYAKLQRVAVMKEARGLGLGRKLVDVALKFAADHPEVMGSGWNGAVLVHAQVAIEQLWTKLGFITDPNLGNWDEEGIQHLGMWRTVDVKDDTD